MIGAIFGITYFLAQRGLEPAVSVCLTSAGQLPVGNQDCDWETPDPDDTYFSTLCLAGIIMLSIYLLPMVMRPLDFIMNFKEYTMGFISYMLMMPVFTNV